MVRSIKHARGGGGGGVQLGLLSARQENNTLEKLNETASAYNKHGLKSITS